MPPDDAAGARLPNLVVAGVTKAGTTSLFGYLGQHPDVCPSDVKEVRYFNALRFEAQLEPIAAYERHFLHCSGQRYILEATPSYFYGGHVVASAINDLGTSAHIVVSLREPVSRCWSWFQFVKSRTGIPKAMSFSSYLDACEELHRTGADAAAGQQSYWGLGGGCYASWLEDWVKEFGDRLKIIFFDDLVSDPGRTVKSICTWLDMDTQVVDDFNFSIDNKTVQYRHGGLQKIAVTANRHGERFLQRHRRLKVSMRRLYYGLNETATADSMSGSDRERLAAFYQPHMERLQSQLEPLGLAVPDTW